MSVGCVRTDHLAEHVDIHAESRCSLKQFGSILAFKIMGSPHPPSLLSWHGTARHLNVCKFHFLTKGLSIAWMRFQDILISSSSNMKLYVLSDSELLSNYFYCVAQMAATSANIASEVADPAQSSGSQQVEAQPPESSLLPDESRRPEDGAENTVDKKARATCYRKLSS